MSKRLICSVLLGLWVGQASASTSAEYNIAKGLAPAVKDQSIAVLKPFAGDFRILGSKIYTHDEQAKFSPLIMQSVGECLPSRKLPGVSV